jgi:hypothetical protein
MLSDQVNFQVIEVFNNMQKISGDYNLVKLLKIF